MSKPLNGIGPGAGLNARDKATMRELVRVAVETRKLEGKEAKRYLELEEMARSIRAVEMARCNCDQPED